MSSDDIQQLGIRRSLYNCFAAIVVLACTLILNSYGGTLSRAYALATQQQPEHFTELYFNTSPSRPLPTSAPVGKLRTFSFHITNHEHKTFHYVYTVTMQVNGQTTPVMNGSVDIADGQSADVNVPFTTTIPAATATIDVALKNPAEHINFRSES